MATRTSVRWWLSVTLTAALSVMTAAESSTGVGMPSCAKKLNVCADYLNATTPPPKSCCDPFSQVLEKERDCLCGLYESPTILQSFGINMTQLSHLPTLCKLTNTNSSDLCQGSDLGSPSPSPGGESESSYENKSAAEKITGTTLVSSILLIIGACLFY